jgi:hypothetical protein
VSSSRDHESTIAPDLPRSRRQLLAAGGIAAVAGVLGALGISNGTQAKDGQFLRVGQKNSATSSTNLQARKGPGLLAVVTGDGAVAGVRGRVTSQKGIGVQGWADAKRGKTVGVEGKTASPDGTAGQFVAGNNGTAVLARASGREGVALQTEGRLKFGKRTGVTTTSGGAEFVIPVGGGLSESSHVLATLQDHFPGIHVESASVLDPSEGLVVIRLNQAVPEAARVAWLVLD